MLREGESLCLLVCLSVCVCGCVCACVWGCVCLRVCVGLRIVLVCLRVWVGVRVCVCLCVHAYDSGSRPQPILTIKAFAVWVGILVFLMIRSSCRALDEM